MVHPVDTISGLRRVLRTDGGNFYWVSWTDSNRIVILEVRSYLIFRFGFEWFHGLYCVLDKWYFICSIRIGPSSVDFICFQNF